MMNKEFIPYEEALAMSELGYEYDNFGNYYIFNDGGTLAYDDDRHRILTDNPDVCLGEISAPLYQEAFRWFREKYNLLHTVNIDLSNNLNDKVYIYTIEDHLGNIVDRSEEYNTYEEAELACLKKLIEIVNQN